MFSLLNKHSKLCLAHAKEIKRTNIIYYPNNIGDSDPVLQYMIRILYKEIEVLKKVNKI